GPRSFRVLGRDGGLHQHGAAHRLGRAGQAPGRCRASRTLEDDDLRGGPAPERDRRASRARRADDRPRVPR
ncbi:MAG: Mobile element protein, partial [uncultured Chloroflexia bacterium]